MNNPNIQEEKQTIDGDAANSSGGTAKEDPKQEQNKKAGETMHKKPKNLQQGLMFGATKILDGAVGGLGVAVAAPVMGAKLGAEKKGFLGGTVGFVGGAAVG